MTECSTFPYLVGEQRFWYSTKISNILFQPFDAILP